jgi:hypothetical protein
MGIMQTSCLRCTHPETLRSPTSSAAFYLVSLLHALFVPVSTGLFACPCLSLQATSRSVSGNNKIPRIVAHRSVYEIGRYWSLAHPFRYVFGQPQRLHFLLPSSFSDAFGGR